METVIFLAVIPFTKKFLNYSTTVEVCPDPSRLENTIFRFSFCPPLRAWCPVFFIVRASFYLVILYNMLLFFDSDIEENFENFTFDKSESRHIAKVLRKNIGSQITITNGKVL